MIIQLKIVTMQLKLISKAKLIFYILYNLKVTVWLQCRSLDVRSLNVSVPPMPKQHYWWEIHIIGTYLNSNSNKITPLYLIVRDIRRYNKIGIMQLGRRIIISFLNKFQFNYLFLIRKLLTLLKKDVRVLLFLLDLKKGV